MSSVLDQNKLCFVSHKHFDNSSKMCSCVYLKKCITSSFGKRHTVLTAWNISHANEELYTSSWVAHFVWLYHSVFSLALFNLSVQLRFTRWYISRISSSDSSDLNLHEVVCLTFDTPSQRWTVCFSVITPLVERQTICFLRSQKCS